MFTYKAIQLINDGDAESLDQSSTLLFGINSDLQGAKLSTNGNGPNGDLVFTDVTGCRWYQFGCHLRWLFGTEEGRKTLKSITDVLTIIIKFL